MFERFKDFKKLNEEIRIKKSPEIDGGRQVAEICVSSGGEFLSPYMIDGEPVISEEAAQILERSVKHFRPAKPVTFKLRGDGVKKEEENLYSAAVKNYYHAEFSETYRELKKCNVLSVIMTVVAAIIFAAAVILSNFEFVDQVFLNIIDVVAWVFMWEAADIYVFRRHELKLSRIRYFNMIEAKIEVI